MERTSVPGLDQIPYPGIFVLKEIQKGGKSFRKRTGFVKAFITLSKKLTKIYHSKLKILEVTQIQI